DEDELRTAADSRRDSLFAVPIAVQALVSDEYGRQRWDQIKLRPFFVDRLTLYYDEM
ncbi:MAG: hypothetical protein RLZ12_76, partial [Bacillota bacterium]